MAFKYYLNINGNRILSTDFTGTPEEIIDKENKWQVVIAQMLFWKDFDEASQESMYIIVELNVPFKISEDGVFLSENGLDIVKSNLSKFAC